MRQFFIILTLILSTQLWAQPKALFDYRVMYNDDQTPYVECYFQMYQESITNATDSKSVTCTVIFMQDSTVATYSKSTIVAKPIGGVWYDFPHLERLQVSSGDYTMKVILLDDATQKEATFSLPMSIGALPSKIVSTVPLGVTIVEEASETFERSGVKMVPHISEFYSENEDKVSVYTEIYGASLATKGEKFAAFIKLVEANSGEVVNNMQKVKMYDANAVVPIFSSFSLDEVYTGSYRLDITLVDKENKQIAYNYFPFDRINPKPRPVITDSVVVNESFIAAVSDIDSLSYFVGSLMPIASKKEAAKILDQETSLPSVDDKKRFFYYFWLDRNSERPDLEWQEYYKEVRVVEEEFGTQIRNGYATDRGNTYLKYGAPNDRVIRENEPSAYPYEIWHYYNIKNFSNRKFVFYNTDIAGNNYRLLHSDLPGELKNPQWQIELTRRDNKDTHIDATNPTGHFGNRSGILFDNPH